MLRLIDESRLIDRRTTNFVGCFVIEIGWIVAGRGRYLREKDSCSSNQRICWIPCNPVDSGLT